MSCTFWNMRRRLKAQAAQKDRIITNVAEAQAAEKKEEPVSEKVTETPIKKSKKGGAKNDNSTN